MDRIDHPETEGWEWPLTMGKSNRDGNRLSSVNMVKNDVITTFCPIREVRRFYQKWSHVLIKRGQDMVDKWYAIPLHHRQKVIGADGQERRVPRVLTNVNQLGKVPGFFLFPSHSGEKSRLNKMGKQWHR